MTELQENDGERLQKYLASSGVASRRSCEVLIRQGRVRVNGAVAQLGQRVRPGDIVTIDDKPVGQKNEHLYLMLNKPSGYVTTSDDPQGRAMVFDLVPRLPRIFPVGRLDANSEGLLLLTNDGELAYRLTHPRFTVEKEYRALVAGRVDQSLLARLRAGVELEGKLTAHAEVTKEEQTDQLTWLRFVIHEGRKRQIRRMCEAVGLEVRRLIRVRIGPLHLGNLPVGSSRVLREGEVRALEKAVRGDVITGIVIAIDGPAGSGKSSLAEAIARRHHLLYLDTGVMYRAVALLALRQAIDPGDQAAMLRLAKDNPIEVGPPTGDDGRPYTVLVGGQDVTWDIFTPDVDRAVSMVAAISEVREVLVQRQREIARRGPSVVVGRDIGTVVLPDAPIKIYVDASPEVRARRRQAQLHGRRISVPYEKLLEDIRQRDKLDSERLASPLSKAPDAVVLNTDETTLDEELAFVEDLLRRYQAGQER